MKTLLLFFVCLDAFAMNRYTVTNKVNGQTFRYDAESPKPLDNGWGPNPTIVVKNIDVELAAQSKAKQDAADRLTRIQSVDISKLTVDDETKVFLSDLKNQVLGK